MPKTVILGTARTPFGKMGGALSSLDATDLGGHAIEHALDRSGVAPDQVQHVVFGQVLQAGQGQIPSRQAQIKGGIPKEVSSETVNKVCASGIRSAGMVDQAVRAGDLDVAVAGGHGVDVGRPVPAAEGALRLSHGRRQGARRDGPRRADQPLHRQADVRRGHRGRRRARDHPPGHGQVRAAQPRARDPGDRRGQAAGGDRAGHDQVEEGRDGGRGRRGAAARELTRDAREAPGPDRARRLAHRRQRPRGQRRRRRAGARQRHVGEGERQAGAGHDRRPGRGRGRLPLSRPNARPTRPSRRSRRRA